jgi:hypothetical protein
MLLLRYPYCNIASLLLPISAACRQAIPHAADCDTGGPDWQNAFGMQHKNPAQAVESLFQKLFFQ